MIVKTLFWKHNFEMMILKNMLLRFRNYKKNMILKTKFKRQDFENIIVKKMIKNVFYKYDFKIMILSIVGI